MIARLATGIEELASTNASLNGVSVSTRTIPAQNAAVGGDWCEAFVLSGDLIALSIGDVCGHGVDSYDTMFAVRQTVRDCVLRGLGPVETLDRAGRFLRTYDASRHATAIFGLLDTRLRTITFANAGHPPPLMTGAGNPSFLEYPDCDLPLGLQARTHAELHVVNVPADTLLVFYTDGVTEHHCNPRRGEVQLRNAVKFAFAHGHMPSASVIERQMLLMGPNRDDAAILTARIPQ